MEKDNCWMLVICGLYYLDYWEIAVLNSMKYVVSFCMIISIGLFE